MSELTQLLIDLFVMFVAAKVAAEVFERVGQPPVIGELLVGALIGPFALGLVGRPDTGLLAAFHDDPASAQEAVSLVYHLVAELGVVVLLFFVGLETRVADILQVGGRAALVAVLGVALPFVLGYVLMGPVLGYAQPAGCRHHRRPGSAVYGLSGLRGHARHAAVRPRPQPFADGQCSLRRGPAG